MDFLTNWNSHKPTKASVSHSKYFEKILTQIINVKEYSRNAALLENVVENASINQECSKTD